MNRIQDLDASSRRFVVKHTFIDVVEQEEMSPTTGLSLRMRKRACSSPDVASLMHSTKEEEDEASLSCGTNECEDEVQGLASTPSDTDTSSEGETLAGSRLPCYAHIKTINPWEREQEYDEPIATRNIDVQGYASSNSQRPITPTIEPNAEEMERLANENARLALENELLRKQFAGAQAQPSNGCGSVQQSNGCGSVNSGLGQQWCFQFMMPSQMVYIPQAAQTMTEEQCSTNLVGVQAPAWGTPNEMSSSLMAQTTSVQVAPHETGEVRDVHGKQRTTVMLRNLPNNYSRAMFLSMLDSEGFSGAYDFVYLPIDFCSRACLGYAFVNLVDVSIVPNFWRTFDGYSKWTLPSRKVCSVSWSGPHQGLEAHVERYRNSPVMHTSVPDEYKPVIFRDGTRVVFPTATKSFRAPRIRNSAKNGCHGSRTDFARAPRAAGTAMLVRTRGGGGARSWANDGGEISDVQGYA
jgi:hypothetical protein